MPTRVPNTQNILKLSPVDVTKMTESELRSAVQVLASAANKRLKRLAKQPMGSYSPAYMSAQKREYTGAYGGKFGTAGKNRNQLLNEFKAVKHFLEAKTGSVKGWKSYRKNIYKDIGGEFNDEEEEKQFWRNYRKLEELHPELRQQAYGSTETQSDLRRTMHEKNASDILREINSQRVSPKRKHREEYIEELSNAGYYLNENHRRVKIDLNDEEDVMKLMSMKLDLEYEKHQKELAFDSEEFFTL